MTEIACEDLLGTVEFAWTVRNFPVGELSLAFGLGMVRTSGENRNYHDLEMLWNNLDVNWDPLYDIMVRRNPYLNAP